MPNEGFVFPNGIPRIRRAAPRNGREYLERKLEDRPETAKLQERKTWTREEKHRGAIDEMTKETIEDNRRAGKYEPEETVRQSFVKNAIVADATGAVK